MKLALLAALAASLLVSAVDDESGGGVLLLRGAGVAVASDEEGTGASFGIPDFLAQPAYCSASCYRDCSCYSDSNDCYPKCCTKDKGNCPNGHMPPCDPPNEDNDPPAFDKNNPDACGAADGNQRGERCLLYDDMCADGLFCKVGDYSCSEEINPSGRCEPEEEDAGCPYIYAPVCGCDGQTYDSKCTAHAGGVNVAKNDRCNLPGNGGEKCYLYDADFCTAGLFCRVGDYACGQELNPQGRCVPKPDMCTYEMHEVCGCDGKTYSNPCSAYADGVNIEENRAC